MPFTTKDQDNDNHKSHNCANEFKGAWWYERCHHSNLNGLYLRGNHSSYANGVNWKDWKGYHYSLMRTEMKIRPVDFWTVIFMAQQWYSTNLKKNTLVSVKFKLGLRYSQELSSNLNGLYHHGHHASYLGYTSFDSLNFLLVFSLDGTRSDHTTFIFLGQYQE